MTRMQPRWIHGFGALLLLTTPLSADHSGSHATPCDAADSAGGGVAGVSPGPVGPPNSLGWDVGSGHCNGSFTLVTDTLGGIGIELGLRAEERRIGQVSRLAADQYEVQTGPDNNAPPATNRAWWNFQLAIASGGPIANLDALTLQIRTDASSNQPAAPSVDLLAARPVIDDRNNQPNATTTWTDLYQISQNPEFGWFMTASDTDANPTGAFNYDEEGAWRFRLTATEGAEEAAAEICIHTPNASCLYAQAGIAKQMTPLDAMLPATIEILYTVEVFGGDTLLDVDVQDDLTAVFGIHGVDWTFTSIASTPVALANPAFDGHTNTQLVNAAQSISGGAVADLTVTIELLTIAAADGSGDFCNQVTLQGTDSLGASYSDLSAAGTDPDANGNGDPAEAGPSCFNRTSVPVTLQTYSVD